MIAYLVNLDWTSAVLILVVCSLIVLVLKVTRS